MREIGNIWRFWAILLLTAFVASAARSQSTPIQDKYKNGRPGAAETPSIVIGCPGVDASGNPIAIICPPTVTAALPVTTTMVGGTTSPTPYSFGSSPAIPAATNNTRTNCTVSNNSPLGSGIVLYYVYTSAAYPTPLPANADTIQPQDHESCSLGGSAVAQNAVWIASNTANAPYVVKYNQ